MQGAKFVKIAVLTEKIGIFPVKFQNRRENNGVFLDWAKSVGAQQKMAQMYEISRFAGSARRRTLCLAGIPVGCGLLDAPVILLHKITLPQAITFPSGASGMPHPTEYT